MQRHALGTKAHLALCLLLWTGVRRSDVVRLGRQHVRNGKLVFTAAKNQRRKPMSVEIPISGPAPGRVRCKPNRRSDLPGHTVWQAFTVAGFGGWFRRRCDEAGLRHCTAHGLRKAGAATAPENGATTQQLMAIFAWSTSKEAERYTRAAQRAKMAGDGMPLLIRR